jgi:hypothetical protein
MQRMPQILVQLDAASVVLRAAKSTETKEKVNVLMRDDCFFKICELFAAARIGNPVVMSIVVELGYRTVCATWAPKMITIEIKI